MKKRFRPILALVLSLFMSVSTLSNTYIIFADDEITQETVTDDENENQSSESADSQTDANSNNDVQKEEDSSNVTQEEQMGDSKILDYFLVDNPVLSSTDTENFVLSLNEIEGYSDFRITVQKNDGTSFDLNSTEQVDKLVKFSKEFTSQDKGEYTVTQLRYSLNGEMYYLNFADLNMNIQFGVDQEYTGYDPNLPDLIQDTQDEEFDNSVIQVTDLKNAQDEVADGVASNSAMSISTFSSDIVTYSNEGITICLDPGHGGNDGGAGAFGANEKTLTLKIAQYCKQELEKYDCNVVMTRTGDTNPSLAERAEIAKNAGAQYLISIHLNSSVSSSASGAEVYYPNTNWRPDLSEKGRQLAQNIQNQLVSLGIGNRGIKIRTIDTNEYPNAFRYDDGTVADYYGVIREAKYRGITGLIIEHCFLSNQSDYNNYLSSDAKLQKLGIADAKGIVSALGLSVKGQTLIEGAPSTNVSQMVTYFINNGGVYDKFSKYGTKYDGILAKKGAKNIEEFCTIFYEEAVAENIRPEVAFCQAMKETGFLRFGGDVKPDQCNFAGLGATGNGVSGNTFNTVRDGVRAQIQHLKAYANTASLVNPCVDSRFGYVKRGCAKYVEWLGKKENPTGDGWATGANYGYDIVSKMRVLLNTQYTQLGSSDMYRLYNPNSGEHFYTSDASEKNHLVSLGWKYEGVGWIAPSASNYPVYRLYNANGGEHHYTMNASEKDNLVRLGWSYEGIGWFSADPNDSNSVPLLREYNPNAFSNNHNYTTNTSEHNYLVSLGWKDEGKAWYAVK